MDLGRLVVLRRKRAKWAKVQGESKQPPGTKLRFCMLGSGSPQKHSSSWGRTPSDLLSLGLLEGPPENRQNRHLPSMPQPPFPISCAMNLSHKSIVGQPWEPTSVTLAIGRLTQEVCNQFQTSSVNLSQKTKNK